jgi:hypothetical protein
MASTWKQISKVEWSTEEDDAARTGEKTKIGALQRIADATELMARNFLELQASRDRYKRWYEDADAERKKLAKSNAALRGVIERAKRNGAKAQ